MKINVEGSQVLDNESFAKVLHSALEIEDRVDREKEHFWVAGLDGKHRIKYLDLVSLGDLNSSIASPREVFRRAIMEGAFAIIVGHNHPTGNATPSSQDMTITRRLKEGGELLGINLLDHVVIGNDSGSFQSIREIENAA